MEALHTLLGARAESQFEQSWPAAKAEIEGIFLPDSWGSRATVATYTFENLKNLWENELSKPIRETLELAGKTGSEFGDWLGEVHYVSVSLYLESLFDHYQDNLGWRIVLMGIPAANVMIGGVASHYQNAQNHNRLAVVSNLLFDQAQRSLADKGGLLPGRKIAKDDWDGVGLIQPPLTEIAGVTIPHTGTDPGKLRLKYVRTTTVKKILSSFICVMPLEGQGETDTMVAALTSLETAGRGLA